MISMASSETAVAVQRDSEEHATLRRVAVSSFLGNFIEWFDYASYSYFATVIALVLMPPGDPTVVTDGSNNTGNVAPLTAAEIARQLGIKVYTIGIGRNGMAPYPAEDEFGRMSFVNMPVVIDEATLKQIASLTGGKYFRATDNNVLAQVFEEIDKLEKTELDVRNFSHTEDNYLPWAVLALLLIVVELVCRQTIVRTLP